MLHLSFVFLVKCTSGFIEDEDFGVLDDCACECNSLLLAARQLAATRADVGVQSSRVALDEFPGVGHAEGFLNLCVGSVGRAEKDVVSD